MPPQDLDAAGASVRAACIREAFRLELRLRSGDEVRGFEGLAGEHDRLDPGDLAVGDRYHRPLFGRALETDPVIEQADRTAVRRLGDQRVVRLEDVLCGEIAWIEDEADSELRAVGVVADMRLHRGV